MLCDDGEDGEKNATDIESVATAYGNTPETKQRARLRLSGTRAT